jgi:hypothetical protein
MANGINMAVAIETIFDIITQRLEFSNIPIIICTNSFLLYEYFVKFGAIKEKKFIIDIMAIQQAYKQKNIFEICRRCCCTAGVCKLPRVHRYPCSLIVFPS